MRAASVPIETDIGDLLEAETLFGGVETKQGGKPVRPSSPRPQVDPTLYEQSPLAAAIPPSSSSPP
jgi:hypothetical protein